MIAFRINLVAWTPCGDRKAIRALEAGLKCALGNIIATSKSCFLHWGVCVIAMLVRASVMEVTSSNCGGTKHVMLLL